MALFDTNTGERGRRRLAFIPTLSLGASNGLLSAWHSSARAARATSTGEMLEGAHNQLFTGTTFYGTTCTTQPSAHIQSRQGATKCCKLYQVSNGPKRGDESPGTLAVSAASSLSETNANAQPTELCDTENAEGISRQHASD